MSFVATAEGVMVVVAVIALWWIATHGKGTAPGRLVAWLVGLIVFWGIIAANNMSAAMTMTGATARGIGTAASGFSAFIHALFSH